jgi:ribosomal protein S18 acetylase RimI-like enzyme
VEPIGADVERPRRTLLVQRPTRRQDEPFTARIHIDALDGMFVRFGAGFLRAYHGSFRRSPHAVSFVVVGPDGVVGFLVGTIDNEAHYRWLARRALPSLGPRAVAALVRRPRVALDTLRTRRRRYVRAVLRRLRPQRVRAVRRGARPGSGSPHGHPVAPSPQSAPRPRRVGVLTHVAVAPGARGTGAGRRLVDAYEHALRDAGVTEARLITDPSGGAPAFYRRLGWSAAGRRTGADGSEVEEFVRTW